MKWIFWFSFALAVYAYMGYPFLMYLRSRWRPRPVRSAPILPSVSIVMAVRNEALTLPDKLKNLASLDYPRDRFEVIVVSDGSTDATNEILENAACASMRLLLLEQHEGKASALNRGMEAARWEIVVFTDARQLIERDALRNLVANFADPEVGCVSGELMLGEPGEDEKSQGLGLYWRIEKLIRQWESNSGAMVGATGAFYGARKELLAPLPIGTLLDDVYQPLQIARRGKRVIFESRARAWDRIAPSQREFRRKVRTLTGNYQLLQLAPWLLTRSNPIRFEFVCHKLLRLLVPFALIAMLASSLMLSGPIYDLAVAAQLVFYGLAMLALLRPRFGFLTRVADVALAFLLLNTAAALAFVYFVAGKKQVWVR
ncbi:MAG TPA: glycosyltransferase family 2 protein [Terriglobia bacterium]|nr:glycosyltransferase family 2 protein [Terriglobia bacterium]